MSHTQISSRTRGKGATTVTPETPSVPVYTASVSSLHPRTRLSMLSLRLTLSVNLYIFLPLVLCAFVCTCCNPPCKLHTCTQVQPLPPSSGRGPSTSWPRPASWRSSVGIGSSGVLEPCCSERRGKKGERKRYDICIASLCVYTVIYSGSR